MFLKCPIVKYVSYEPKQINYQFPTEGVIHEKKIKELMVTIENSQIDEIRKKINSIFAHHRLGQILPFLEIDELGDYLRHLVVCNHEMLDWAYIDYCLAQINKKFPSRWNIPKLELDLAFRSLFSTFILVQPSETERFLFRDFLLMIPEKEKYQRSMLKKLIDSDIAIKFVSFASLITLYNRFIRKVYVEEKDNFHLRKKFSQLNEFFELQFEKIYNKFDDQKMVSAAISIIHSYLLIEQGLEPFQTVINRFEKNIRAMLTLPKNEQDLLGLILGASYSKLLNIRYFQTLPIEEFTAILLKTKRLLIPSDNVQGLIKVFRDAILTYRIHPMLVYIISEGLSSILHHFAILDRKLGGEIDDFRKLFKEVLDFRYEMASIVNKAVEERAWLKDSLSFDYQEFVNKQMWDAIYYVHHWIDDEITNQRINDLIEFLKRTNPHLVKFLELYVGLVTGEYGKQIHDELKVKKKDEKEGLFYYETEQGLLRTLTYLINLSLPDFPSTKIIPKTELMILLIKEWLKSFEYLNLAYNDLFEFLSPIVLEIQAQRIEHDYIDGKPTLALIHSINFFLFDLWKKQQQQKHLTLGSQANGGEHPYMDMFTKVLETFQSRENTKNIVQRLTTDLINIVKATLFNRVVTGPSIRSLIEMEKHLVATSQPLAEFEIDFQKINYILGNIVVALGTFFSNFEKTLSDESKWDLLVEELKKLRSTINNKSNGTITNSVSEIDLFIFPLNNEHALAEAIHIFPMIVEVPKIFFNAQN